MHVEMKQGENCPLAFGDLVGLWGKVVSDRSKFPEFLAQMTRSASILTPEDINSLEKLVSGNNSVIKSKN